MLSDARRVSLRARRAALGAELESLNQELLSLDTRAELTKASAALTERELTRAVKRVQALEAQETELRRAEAIAAQADAERDQRAASGKHPAIQELAKQNATYSRELAALVSEQETTTRRRDEMAEQSKQIAADLANARERLAVAGLSEALGGVMREQRRKLPEPTAYRKDEAQRQEAIAAVGLQQFQVEDRRRALEDSQQALGEIMSAKLEDTRSPEERAAISGELKDLLKVQYGLLVKLEASFSTYLRALGDLDFEQQQLVEQAREYAMFLDERLLWIPSAPRLKWSLVGDLAHAVGWMLSPLNWIETGRSLARELFASPLSNGLALLLLVGLIRARFKLRKTLEPMASKVGKVYTDRFGLTVQALLTTVLLAAPWPLLAALVAWRLGAPVDASEFSRAVSAGLFAMAPPLFGFLTLYHLCRRDGLAAAHFRWRNESLLLLRRHVRWLAIITLSAFFVVAATEWQGDGSYHHTLGRLAFILSALALALFLQRISNPAGALMGPWLSGSPNGWLARLRYIWYPALVGIPLVLAVLAAIGYFYTALQLESRLEQSLWFVLAAVVAHGWVIRWLVVAQRRLALANAWKRHETKSTTDISADGAAVAVDTAEIDIDAINVQTRHLINIIVGWSLAIGLWLTWASVLPALGVLDNVSLWEHTVSVGGVEKIEPITLSDMVFALVLGIIIATAARNVPGVLQIAVLQRLPLDAGSRYAITTVAQYLIVGIGISLMFGAIGVGWFQVQWLVAALGVGLGFGLQEIFANFVSGLIILFERPVRIGDTVTIGELSGTVSRIRIRATTITDWDNKEIIVPNKTFITNQLINWTLSDSITRVVIPIGVAYGTDTDLAFRVIRDTAKTHPLVLDSPELQLFFLGFGDSSLNFELRVFVRQLGDRLPVTHDLHMAIERALRENQVEIPFPQRDLHVRSWTSAALANREDQVPRVEEEGKASVTPLRRELGDDKQPQDG